MLIKYYMCHVNELRSQNKNLKIPSFHSTNTDSTLANSYRNSPLEILFQKINSEITLNYAMMLIIDYCKPKYFTFLVVFILMSDIIEQKEGLKYLYDLKKIFLSCFYVASIYLENDTTTVIDLFNNSEIKKHLIDKICMYKIIKILLSKSLYEIIDHQEKFELQVLLLNKY